MVPYCAFNTVSLEGPTDGVMASMFICDRCNGADPVFLSTSHLRIAGCPL